MTILNFEKCKSEDRANCFADGCPDAGQCCPRFRALKDFNHDNKGAKHGTNEKDKQSKK